MNNVVAFPNVVPRRKPHRAALSRTGDGHKNMHTYLFRSREAVLEADEAELIRDVCSDVDKAQKKLEKLRARLETFQEHAGAELQALTTAETKPPLSPPLCYLEGNDEASAPAPIGQEAQPAADRRAFKATEAMT